jgi:hypothetical protein
LKKIDFASNGAKKGLIFHHGLRLQLESKTIVGFFGFMPLTFISYVQKIAKKIFKYTWILKQLYQIKLNLQAIVYFTTENIFDTLSGVSISVLRLPLRSFSKFA